jgi:phospholipid-binding lipoprotein MlaA
MMNLRSCFTRLSVLAALAAALPARAGDAPAPEDSPVDEADEYAAPAVSDPLQGFNRAMFRFNGTATRFVLRPLAQGYRKSVPAVARRGIGSFFDNLRFPVRFTGSLLQGKVERAGQETGKFLLNSTAGLGGFVAFSDRFPELRDVPAEDIGQALGRWGIGPGPYLVLPLMGPTSLRDGLGLLGDTTLSPANWRLVRRWDWEFRTSFVLVNTVRDLPERLDAFDAIVRASVDPYIAIRNGYLQYRQAEVAK